MTRVDGLRPVAAISKLNDRTTFACAIGHILHAGILCTYLCISSC